MTVCDIVLPEKGVLVVAEDGRDGETWVSGGHFGGARVPMLGDRAGRPRGHDSETPATRPWSQGR